MQQSIQNRRQSSRKSVSDPFIRMYLKEISRIPLLTADEEKELARRIRSGDRIALQKLTESNLRFVIKIAKKFVRQSDQFMEMVNVGNLGLVEAAQRFNPDMNVRFITYAVWWIRQAIFHHLAGMTYAFRVSPKVATILYRARRVLNQPEFEEHPDLEDLAKEMGVSVTELNSAVTGIASTLSLDQPIGEEANLRMVDLIEQSGMLSPEEQALMGSVHRVLRESVQKLSPIEQDVIRLRFGLDIQSSMTLQEVGNRLNRSRERIRQIENDALIKLRNMYAGQNSSSYLN